MTTLPTFEAFGPVLIRAPLLPLGLVPEYAAVAGATPSCRGDAEPTPIELLGAGIEVASPGALAHPRAAHSIFAKYAKRAATRTSAFGYFAAFTSATVGEQTSLAGTGTRLRTMAKPRCLPPEASEFVRLNPTVYEHDREWRFHRAVESEEGSSSREFELASIDSVCGLESFRVMCVEAMSPVDFAAGLAKLLDDPVEACEEWVESAVAEGLLLRDGSAPRLVWGEHELRSISCDSRSHEDDHWLVRNCDECLTLSHDLIRSIGDALSCMESCFPTIDPFGRDLEVRFRTRFDGEPVSLLRALDPEDGLWPTPGSHLRETYSAVAGLVRPYAPFAAAGVPFDGRDEVDIETLPRHATHAAPAHTSAIAVAFSLLASRNFAVEPSVVLRGIDNSGGMGLLSRAALSDERLAAALREIEHACATPQPHRKVRAEIVHAPTTKSEWIGVRPSLVSHEIQLFAQGQARGEHRLDCSELELRQIDGRIVLWSPRLDCEIEPVQSSPLAHEWAHLPVYRFLCQFQRYGRAGPRVPELIENAVWQSCDVATARLRWRRSTALRWRNVFLREREWEVHLQAKIARSCASERVAEIVRIAGLPHRICIGVDSERRELDLDQAADAEEFAGVLSKGRPVRIAESLWHEPDASPLTFDGRPHANEFIVPLRNRPGIRAGSATVCTALHVYVAASRTGDILRRAGERLAHPPARAWFFTRMADLYHHLRIRVVHAPHDVVAVDALVAALGEELCAEGAWKVVRAPYAHEHERYGGPLFEEAVTQIFALHTGCILRLPPASSVPANEAMLTGAVITHSVLSQFGLAGAGLYQEAGRLRTWALQMVHDNTAALELLSALHREHGPRWYEAYMSRGDDISPWNAVARSLSAAALASSDLANSWEKAIGREALSPIAGRFAHMCLNRYFEDDSMVHELASHDLLVRCLRRDSHVTALASDKRLLRDIP